MVSVASAEGVLHERMKRTDSKILELGIQSQVSLLPKLTPDCHCLPMAPQGPMCARWCGGAEQRELGSGREQCCLSPTVTEDRALTETTQQPIEGGGVGLVSLQTPIPAGDSTTGQWHFYLQLDQKKAYRHFFF